MEKDLFELLSDPPKEYRPIPFWSWNEKLEVDETLRQIRLMDEAGMGGYFMHARGGLETEYMGKEWMDNVRAAVKEGVSRRMGAWGYDENGWPSGFGGGKVNGRGEVFQQKYLRWEEFSEEKPRTIAVLESGGKKLRFYYEVNPFYVDTLDKKVIAAFIEETHAKYEEELKEDFLRMAGFFTDEPQISRNGIPWSFVLPGEYEARYGEELLPRLPELFFETGEYRRTRIRFYALIRDLFCESYTRQIYDWCKAHGSHLTGHMVLEENLHSQLVSNGACMPNYEYMDIPGMDLLCRFLGEPLTPAQLSSAARQTGKSQVLSETFALCGWNVSFEDLRWLYEWQMVRGINLLCQHLEGYSLRGIRKRDYPASLSYQQPWWDDYKPFVDAVSRIGMLLSKGRAPFSLLVLHPESSAWACYNDTDNPGLTGYDRAFARLLDRLEDSQIPYDLGDERIIERHGRVDRETGRIIVGEQSYSAVLVPPSLNLGGAVYELLRQFAQRGGEILWAGETPVLVDGIPCAGLEELTGKGRRVSEEEAVSALPTDVRPFAVTALPDNKKLGLTFRRFEKEKMTFVYLVNSSDHQKTYTLFAKGGSVLEYDPFKDEKKALFFERDGDQVALAGTLEPAGSALFFVYDEPDAVKPRKKAAPELRPLALSPVWSLERADENALTLDYCKVWIDGELRSERCPVNNIQEMACAAMRPVDVEMEYRFTVKELPGAPLYLVMETPEKYAVSLNGKPIEGVLPGYWKDPSFKKLDLTPALTEGEQVLKLKTHFSQTPEIYQNIQNALIFESEKNKLSYKDEIEAVYLAGDFGVEAAGSFTPLDRHAYRYDGEFAITRRPDTLREGYLGPQGFPFFAGRMTLSQTVTLTKEGALNRCIAFARREGNLLKVRVNGQDAGTIAYRPYALSLEGLLKAGDNRIEVEMVGNLRNLLGPHHLAEGETYAAGPGSFFENSPLWRGGVNKDWDDRYCFADFGVYPQDPAE